MACRPSEERCDTSDEDLAVDHQEDRAEAYLAQLDPLAGCTKPRFRRLQPDAARLLKN